MDREQILHQQAVCRLYQQRADDALQPWGVRAPAPVIDEDVDSYRKRLLIQAKRLLPDDHAYRNVSVKRMTPDVLPGYEEWIYGACKQTAFNNDSVPMDAPLRRVEERDPNGNMTIRYVGQRSFIHDFTVPGRRVLSFLTPHGPVGANGAFLR